MQVKKDPLGTISDPQERKRVQKIIELTEAERIGWDFSRYTDYTRVYPIETGYKGLHLLSTHPPDGACFAIYQGDEGPRLVEFGRTAARVLRDFLVELAEADPEVRRQKVEKLRQIGISATRGAVECARNRRYVDKILGA